MIKRSLVSVGLISSPVLVELLRDCLGICKHQQIWRYHVSGGMLLLSLLFSPLSMASKHKKELLPHHAEISPGVHAIGFSHQYASSNCGW